ncbi:MAG TPA: type IV pilus assembly protein PilM [Gemmataceae bacterium]|nr:type IV pilus assembly protein PilM [Gemmataceae bacterium]
MATNNDDASPADHGIDPPAETEAKTSPTPASEKPAKPVAKAPAKPAVKPAAKPGAKPAAKPAAEKPAAKTSPEKRAKAPAPAPKKEEAEKETEDKAAPDGEKEEAPSDEAKEKPEKDGQPDKETAVQTEAAVKDKKKKAKGETGVTTRASLASLSSLFQFKKAAPAGVWGVDLGQCALKAIRLELIDGVVTATAFDYVEHPKILSQPDADPDELTREALQKFLSRNVLRGDTVAISVPGQSGLARFVKLPPVEEKKIPDIVRFEAKQQIPFNLNEVVWDYQKLGSNELAAGFVETEIGLFAMKRDMVNRYLQHFKEVGVEVHLVQMAPLSLCNFVAYDLLGRDSGAAAEEGGRPKKQCVTALDIGADSSNLVITDGGRIIWQRPIPLGGNHFTRALTKDLKLTFAKAEHLKRNAVKSPDLKKILASLKPVLSDFVGEVQRSLGYFTNTHRDANIEYMIGLGNAFRLPGLQRYLAEKLQMDVRKLGKMERLVGDGVVTSATYTENILSFAVAYGLALQGLKRTKLHTNLLPGEIRAERAVRGKKPWAVAAAALLLLGFAGFAAAGACNYLSYASDPLPKYEGDAKSTVDQVTAAQGQFDAAVKAAQKEEADLKSIVAGQDERKNWLELTHFLFNDALPQPDGSNLSKTAYAAYYDGGAKHPGRDALEEMQKYWQGTGAGAGKPGEAEELPAAIDNLVQVNIEFFDQRYCDDLSAAWKQIKETAPTVKGNTENLRANTRTDDFDKGPEGKGWLVEVHGSTYFKNEPNRFLVSTLVDNIYQRSVKPAAAASGTPSASGASAAQPEAASDKDVYLGHISSVVLFDAATAESGKASIVGQSVLDKLMGGSGATNAMGGGSQQMGAAVGAIGPGATGPSGNPNGPGGGMGGGPGASSATTAGPGGVSYKNREDWKPLSPFMQSAPGNAGREAGKHKKTEFVIVFIWKEPISVAAYRGEDPNYKPPSPSSQNMQPGGAPPMNQSPAAGGAAPAEDKPLSPRSGDL